MKLVLTHLSFYTRYFNHTDEVLIKYFINIKSVFGNFVQGFKSSSYSLILVWGDWSPQCYSNIKISEHLELEPLKVDTEELIQRNSEEAEVPTEGEALVV